MSRTLLVIVAFCMLLLVPSAGGALTGTERTLYKEDLKTGHFSDGLVLKPGEYKAYIVQLAKGDKMYLTVQLSSGNAVDVYTLESSDYADYKKEAVSFAMFAEYSKENLKYLEYPNWFSPYETGDIVIVIDNANVSLSGATAVDTITANVSLNVSYKVKASSSGGKGFLPGFEGIVLLTSLVALFIIKKTKNG